MDKLLIIINSILAILTMISSIIKLINRDIKDNDFDNKSNSKEIIVQKIKEDLNTHGIEILYLCSIFILIVNSKKSLSKTLLIQGMYIPAGIQSLFFLIKNNDCKSIFLLKILCIILVSYIISFMI